MRTKNLMRNSFYGMLGQAVLIGFGFVCQRVLNMKLGEALVGLNSVISNILAILSVSELGIATAVVYNLYHALAVQDEQQIAGLMNFYRRAYNVFAVVITLLGLAVMPYLPHFLKENPFSMRYVHVIYLLWLARTVAAYLLSYQRSILIADQQEYIVSIVVLIANVLDYSVIIVLVYATGDFVLPLALNIVIDTVSNLWIRAYVNRRYPYLRRFRHAKTEPALRRQVFHNVKNIFASHLADKLLVATDNVIISSFISVAFVGLYNNYCLVINALTNITRALANAVQPSIGTLFVRDHRQGGELLRGMTFFFFLIAASSGCAVYNVIGPFVSDVWLDAGYLLDPSVVAACVINYVVLLLCLPVTVMMGVTGLFDRERNIAIVSALCNMVLSLGLVKTYGIYGVLAGTLAAYVLQLVCRSVVFHRSYLEQPMARYLCDLAEYLGLALAETLLVKRLAAAVYGTGGWLRLLLLALAAAGLPLGINLLLFGRSSRMAGITALWRRSKDEREDVCVG